MGPSCLYQWVLGLGGQDLPSARATYYEVGTDQGYSRDDHGDVRQVRPAPMPSLSGFSKGIFLNLLDCRIAINGGVFELTVAPVLDLLEDGKKPIEL